MFLSIYVDDLKMAAARCSLAPMWAELGHATEGMAIDPEVRLVDNQYLGMPQWDIYLKERAASKG